MENQSESQKKQEKVFKTLDYKPIAKEKDTEPTNNTPPKKEISFSQILQKNIDKINKRQRESQEYFIQALKKVKATGYLNTEGKTINIMDL